MAQSYSLPKIIAIVGPTASGKTKLALSLAKKLGGEIVSTDSRQIYSKMDIGTAKPTSRELKEVDHHLINIRNPNQSYSLAQYQRDAIKALNQILHKGKIPLLVGGTGQYIAAILENWNIPKIKADKHLRTRLEKQLKTRGLYYLFGKLTALDPDSVGLVDPKNPRRVIRALEVSILSGQPFSKLRKKNNPFFKTLILGLKPNPKELKKNIAHRTKLMIEQGLVKEVKALVKKYGSRRVPFDAIGYQEIIQYLEGKISLAKAIELINQNTWKFSKRQMTWFKRMPVVWITSPKTAEKAIDKFIKS